MNALIKQAYEILRNKQFEYAFCGGSAIDLFLGYESRMHGDIDISSYWKDRNNIIEHMWELNFSVYEMLGEGKAHHITDIEDQKKIKRNIFCFRDTCDLIRLSATDERGIYYIDFQHIGQTKPDFIEFLFNDRTDTDFIYARNHDIRRTLDKAVLMNEGIPYLAPEICLLYKSTDISREGYQKDHDNAIGKMTEEQKRWLNDALVEMYPEGHKWINK
jgi:hypothetical protein